MPVNALLRSCCMLLLCKTILYTCFVDVVFFSCVVTVFFGFPIAKLMVHIFFDCFTCTLHSVLICAVHNYLCVFLHIFGVVTFLCVIPCLPYFLQWFCALLHSFLLPKCSLLHFLVFAGFSRCHFLVFFVFLAEQFDYFCVVGYLHLLCCVVMFCLHCCMIFSWFFDSFHTVVFLLIFYGLNQFEFAVLGGFFGYYLYFPFFFFVIGTQNRSATLFLPTFPSHEPIWSPQPSLTTSCFVFTLTCIKK